MLGRVLLIIGWIWLGRESIYSARQFVKKKRATSYRRIGGEDRISALSDDLLVQILSLVPTKDAVATMILSKRWQSIWTMVPRLEYKEIKDCTHKRFLAGLLGRLFGQSERPRSIWRFLNESLKLHKAPILERLAIELGQHCPVDANVGKWIAKAVDGRVRKLEFNLMWSAEPTSLPKSLYICDTLVYLRLSNKVFVDVSSPVCLPSLKYLSFVSVVYKDEDSLVRLLSSCPILKYLYVMRHHQDNVTKFSVKVPSLETIVYDCLEPRVLNEENVQDIGGSLVIDSALLKAFKIFDNSTDSYSIENKPRLDKATICVRTYLDDKFMKSLSSVRYLDICLSLATVACCDAIIFSQLIVCKICPFKLDWFEPFVSLLQNSPKLKVLVINQIYLRDHPFQLSWNQPSSVPACLSTNLEIFKWKVYGGTTEEKEIVRYIFANSKCLKRATYFLKPSCSRKDRKKILEELNSMYKISTSFHSVEVCY